MKLFYTISGSELQSLYCLPIDVQAYYIAMNILQNVWNRGPKAGINHLLCWIQLSYPNGLELNCLTGEMSGVGGRKCNTGLSLASRI